MGYILICCILEVFAHVPVQVVCHPLYSGTQEVVLKFLSDKYNVDVTLVGYSIDEYRAAIRPNTKVKNRIICSYFVNTKFTVSINLTYEVFDETEFNL